MTHQKETRPGSGAGSQDSVGTDNGQHTTSPQPGRPDNLARLARKRAKVSKSMVAERVKVLLADVEDQLSAEYQFDEEVWADINRSAQEAVAKADAQIAELCRSWGVPERFPPGLNLSWYSRGENALAARRAELRKLAEQRLDALAKTAKTTIDVKLLDVETALVRDGLQSAEAHAFLEAMPTPDELLPRVDIGELEGGDEPERRGWEPPAGAAADLLTPTTGTAREERRKAIARALAANPDGSDRQIARMAGVDHKTVAKVRGDGGEIPTEDGELPRGEVAL